MDREALTIRLLALFVDELDDHVRAMNADLLALEVDASNAERLRSLFRTAHTLKGAARAVGALEIESACHAIEDLLAAARDGEAVLNAEAIQLLFSAADDFQAAGGMLRQGKTLSGSGVTRLPSRIERLRYTPHPAAGIEGGAGTSPVATRSDDPVREFPHAASDRRAEAPAEEPARSTPPTPTPRPANESRPADEWAGSSGPRVLPPEIEAGSSEHTPDGESSVPASREAVTVRVGPERLDELLASAGELQALGRRAESRTRELQALDQLLASGTAAWQRQALKLRHAGWSAGAADGAEDPVTMVSEHMRQVNERVRGITRDSSTDARHLSRASEALADQIRRMRMRPVREALEGFDRTVRDLAASAGKQVRLEIDGTDVEMDRMVLETLREALLPVVRNAIDHGLETPEVRSRLGKPPQGTIRIATRLQGDRVVVDVSDDGSGIDAAALRQRLGSSGTAPAADADLAELLLGGGISSRASATRISGRGVGLDIVRAGLEKVRGRVTLSWEAGRGTRIRMEFPPSLASLRVLLVSVGSQVLALPTLAIERLVRLQVQAVRTMEGRPVLMVEGGPVPLVSLARVLGPPLTERPLTGIVRVVILGSAGQRVALVVDEMLTEEELIVRPIQTGGAPLPLIIGAATLATGAVAPLLDASALFEEAQSATGAPPRIRDQQEQRIRRILVADDSLTTRALEQSLLEAAGYVVTTAVDGLDAWRLLQEEVYDLVVSDVEMPRMDGFRLCETVRGSAKLRQLPFILITARESVDDRARGLEAGADAYLPKSSFDQEQLLSTVRQLLD